MQGKTISHYKVLEKIGGGGMGEVYLAEDTSLERKVALKFLPESLQQDETAHKRFIREAKAAAALDHPYICHINEVAQTESGQDFISMEYVQGQTLKEKLAEGPLLFRDAIQVGIEIAEALEIAHREGIIHRDLKPANIMLTEQGHAKVMDFGLAKKVVKDDGPERDITSALTREGSTLGTLAYMSPEQIRGEEVDHRSDVFSFGIVLYEMLTGVHPFRKARQAETTAAILEHDPAPLPRYAEHAPELLQHTISKMLAKNLHQRYQAVHEIRTNLSSLVTDTGKAEKDTPLAWLWKVAAISLVVLAGIWLASRLFTPASEVIDSLAVLPFETRGDHPHLQILRDAIPDNLITKLSPLVKVMARSSSFRFGPGSDVQEVGERLDVGAVVTGTLTTAGDFFSISVELVDTKDGRQLWGRQLNNWDLEDVIENLEVLTTEVAEALQLRLTEEEAARLTRQVTSSAEAYLAYQEGRRVYKTLDSQKGAIGYFEAAIAADPDYAPAYAGISMVYGELGLWAGDIPVREIIQSIEKYAAKALELDPSSAEAYCAVGQQRALQWDWLGAEAAFRKAIELNPSLPDGYRCLAVYFLVPTGKLDEAITQLEKALDLDPLGPWIHLNLGMVYGFGGSIDEAVGYFRKVRELDPDFWLAHFFLGVAYLHKGMIPEARAEFGLADAKECPGCLPPLETPSILWALGEKEEAYKALEDLPQGGKRTLQEALLFIREGLKEEAFQRLERLIDDPDRVADYGIVTMKVTPYWAPLSDEPRFQDLLRRMNLPLD